MSNPTMLIARLAGLRLLRARPWKTSLLALIPSIAALIAAGRQDDAATWSDAIRTALTLLALLPPLLAAAAISEEIEQGTYTYLWSRPLPRWTVLVGKLAVLAPVVGLLLALSVVLASLFIRSDSAIDTLAVARAALAFFVGGAMMSCIAASIGTLVTRYPVAIAVLYVVVFDLPIGGVPFELRRLSVTHHVQQVVGAGGDSNLASLGLCAIPAAVWLIIALVRISSTSYGLRRAG